MSPQKTISSHAWLEIAILSLIWGASFLAFSIALRELGVFTTVAFRTGGGAIILWIYIIARRMPLPRDPKIWGAFLVMGILNNAIPFSLIAWGQLHIPSGLASILNGSTAIIGAIVAAIAFADERLTMRKTIGVLFGFFGVATAIGLSALTQFDITSLAQLAIVGSSTAYALSGVWAKLTMKSVAPQMAAAGMMTAAALIMVPLGIYVDGVPSFDYRTETWIALLQLAALSTAVAYLLYYRLLGMVGSGNLMLVTLTVAPVAIILGALVLGEDLSANAYVGFAFLALGLLIIDGRIFKRKTVPA